MDKRWLPKKQPSTTSEISIIKDLKEQIGVSEEMGIMLWQRGINNFDEAKYFFRPKLENLHDPFLMKDMDKAVERLELAINNNEKILVFGDYDVDGTTAVALVFSFLNSFYKNIEFYTPDRYLEGYGLSNKGIEYANQIGAGLVITLDCGIKSVDKINWAKENFKLDFIICDHHEPGDTLPDAWAVLDPKRPDCPYPFKELSGNGVGFKLMTAYSLKNNIPMEELYQKLDLAMVSIASDIVPILDENRILAYFGLKKLNENPSVGLKALMDVSGANLPMNIESVVFTLGPRINAAGRIDHADSAVKLLLEQDYDKAYEFAENIQEFNLKRRNLDASITEEAIQLINEAKTPNCTVLYKEDWNKGVIGIVASRCIEHYYRPTIIFTKTAENLAAGSARSVRGFDLYSAIEQCGDLLEQFGGHMHAAGMTIKIDKIPEFREKFNEIAGVSISEDMQVEEINYDLNLSISKIDKKFYNIMRQMAPFGPGNLQPTFLSTGLSLASNPVILKEKHLKLELLDRETGVTMTALGFFMREKFYDSLINSESFDAVYTIEENNFRGNSTLQLFIKDLKFYS